MKLKFPLFHCLVLAILLLSSGCATLPDVSAVIDEAPTTGTHRRIVSAKGVLSPQQSKALIDRLERSVDSTDVLARHSALVESITDSPLTKGNRVLLLADGQAAYAAMFKLIKSARIQINLESYIIEDDETGRTFADLLLEKQAQGVQVRIIYDSVGCMNTPAAFFQRLRNAGIQVVEFNPLNPLNAGKDWQLTQRDHRKILIADNTVAIIGGINISKVYSSSPLQRKRTEPAAVHWRDTDIQLEGPAVAELEKLFRDTWLKQKGPQLSTLSAPPLHKEKGSALVRIIGSTPGETNRIPFIVYVSAISFAERSIHLTNSYFIPDEQIVKALVDAAARGVDVKIILPGITDSKLALHAQRYYYSELLRAGVKIYERSNALLHAKTAVIDQVWSTVGSTNLDFLSLLNNDEVNAVILSHEFAGEMEQMFVNDLAGSQQIQRDQWENRPLLPRVREWLLNLFSRLL